MVKASYDFKPIPVLLDLLLPPDKEVVRAFAR